MVGLASPRTASGPPQPLTDDEDTRSKVPLQYHRINTRLTYFLAAPKLTPMTEQTSELNSALNSNTRTVEVFLNALQDEDYETAEATLAENFVWENAGWPTMRGRQRVVNLFRRGEGRVGFEVKIHRIAADGATVLTERTDALIFGPLRLQFWVCGVFEVHDGRITLWRDYFDLFDLFKATVRGLAALVFPSLRATL